MKIFVAGTGRVAKCVIEKLNAKGHTIVCGSRHPESIDETDLCKPIIFDLHADTTETAELLKGFDAVYFLAGSRGKDLLQTDAFGAMMPKITAIHYSTTQMFKRIMGKFTLHTKFLRN